MALFIFSLAATDHKAVSLRNILIMRPLIVTVVLLLMHLSVIQATIWPVGPGKAYLTPSAVSNLVVEGDTVLIDPVAYPGDVAFWKVDHLLLIGNQGRPHLNAQGKAAGQKAIWVIQGDDVTVENIEFSHCTVPDKNGAGIRQEGTNLTVRQCYFHDNENGILAGDNAASTILIEFTIFGYNGYGDGYSHNIYVNHIGHFIFRHNWSHDSKIGHLVKSRAHINEILYNRLESAPGSGVSYEIDLPNGGLSRIIGNIIYQPTDGQNSGLIAYGMEGLSNPGPHELYSINNTMVNAKTVGRFFTLNSGTAKCKAWNNFLVGGGSVFNGPVMQMDTSNNLVLADIDAAGFINPSALDFGLASSSPSIDSGTNPGQGGNWDLIPEWEYKHPADRVIRETYGALDVGALEAVSTSAVDQPEERILHIWRNGSCLGHSMQLPARRWQFYTLDGRFLSEVHGEGAIQVPLETVVVVLLSAGRFIGSGILPL